MCGNTRVKLQFYQLNIILVFILELIFKLSFTRTLAVRAVAGAGKGLKLGKNKMQLRLIADMKMSHVAVK